jgi:hypothetical protein
MASKCQIAANRRNAQNSTGPTSSEGKTVSSQNAFRTGIDAKSQVVAFENAADLEELTAEYYLRFASTSPEDRCLVDTLINSEWLRRRYMTVEARVWDREIEKAPSVGEAFSGSSQILTRLQSRLNSAQRSFANALKQLTALRASCPADPEPAHTLPIRRNHKPQIPQEPFDMRAFNMKMASFLDSTEPITPQSLSDVFKTLEPEPDMDEALPIAA